MNLNPSAAVLWLVSWTVIAVTALWCYWRMLTENRRGKGERGPLPPTA